MAFRIAFVGLLFALLVSAVLSQSSITVEIDYRTRDSINYKAFPFCRVLEIAPDQKAPGMSLFSCRTCVQGFEPVPDLRISAKLIPGLNTIDFEGGPIEMKQLCKVSMINPPNTDPNSNVVTKYCANDACKKFIPNCKKFATWKIGQDVDDQLELIFCTECEDPFEPLPFSERVDNAVESIDLESLAKVCTRNEERRACGEVCQKEMPGCLEYETQRYDEYESGFKCTKTMPGLYPIEPLFVKLPHSISKQKQLVDFSFADSSN